MPTLSEVKEKMRGANLCSKCGSMCAYDLNANTGLCERCTPTLTAQHYTLVDSKFDDLLKKMAELHGKKARDYGNSDPYFNLRAGEQLGIPAWKSALLRLSDKFHRILNFSKSQTLAVETEKIEDTLLDLANYALITLILYQEHTQCANAELKICGGGIESAKTYTERAKEEARKLNLLNHNSPIGNDPIKLQSS